MYSFHLPSYLSPKPNPMKYLLLCGVLLALPAFAQKKKIPNPKPFAATITEADLKRHLTIVASAEMEGRETATPGQKKAAAYIESQFRAFGLLPGNQGSYQQQYPVYRDSAVVARILINGKPLAVNDEFQPSSFYSAEGHNYFSEVVYAGYGILDSLYDSYGKTSVAGKAILIAEGGPTGLKGSTGRFSSTGTQAKVTHARNRGASVVFMVTSQFVPNTNMAGRMYLSLFRETQYPGTYLISAKTADLLTRGSWKSLSDSLALSKPKPRSFKAEVEVSYQKQIQTLSASNVLGVIEGTDKKDEYVVITAHYDHLGKRGADIYYGADDDGSGTVGVLEMAEAFAKAKAEGKGPRRSILFMTVSGEEKGLWGSNYFSQHPTVNPEKISLNINTDMIGRVDTERKTADTLNYVYVVGDDKLSSESKPLLQSVNQQYTQISLDYRFNDAKDPYRIYFRSDHYNFAKIGVPIIFFYDGMLKSDYHKPTDTIEKINFALMAKRTKLAFHAAWEIANRENMMKRDLPLPKE
jgi:hypothetical protein